MQAERERLELMNADPFDLEVQKKIAEAVEKKNIEENMNMAIEEAPESFGQVVMLWINLRVNGHHVKGKILLCHHFWRVPPANCCISWNYVMSENFKGLPE